MFIKSALTWKKNKTIGQWGQKKHYVVIHQSTARMGRKKKHFFLDKLSIVRKTSKVQENYY